MILLKVIYYFLLLSSLICFGWAVGYFKSKKFQKERINQLFIALISVRFISDFMNLFSTHIFHNAYPVFHLSIIIEFLIILWIFQKVDIKRIYLFFTIIGLICFISDLTLTSNFFANNFLTTIFTYTVSVILSWRTIVFVELSKNEKRIIFPLAIFYNVALFYSIFEELLYKNHIVFIIGFSCFGLANLFLNFSYIKAIWWMRKE
jgi:hypothetical protein